MTVLRPVQSALEQGRRDGVVPGAAASVWVSGTCAHASFVGDACLAPALRALEGGDLFDLASLTKLYVASAVARFVDRGALDLDAAAASWAPEIFEGGKALITVRQLLAHASGLAAWRHWYEDVARDPVGRWAFLSPSARPDGPQLIEAFRRGRAIVEAALAAEPLESSPGTRALYSDLGFMALGFLLERLTGQSLDRVVEAEVLGPLELTQTFYLSGLDPVRAAARRAGRRFVAARRSAPRGDEVVCGAVDDDNAWAMGGVAGHAGLFATASDVARFGQAWLDALGGRSRWLGAATAKAFVARDATPGSDRALGWDTPSGELPAIGRRLGRGERGAVGHLGFTGTSLWLDLDAQVVCALLTNHVHPGGADKGRIRAFRARFHDAVAEALGIGG